jgi:hypothetical protein
MPKLIYRERWAFNLYFNNIFSRLKPSHVVPRNFKVLQILTYNNSREVMLPTSLGMLPLIEFHIKSLEKEKE